MTRKYEDYSVEPDGMLIDGAGREISDFKDILAQRDDLLAALKTIVDGLREGWWGAGSGEMEEGELLQAEAIIKRIEAKS